MADFLKNSAEWFQMLLVTSQRRQEILWKSRRLKAMFVR